MTLSNWLRIRPIEAAGALRALYDDPDDTAQVFVLIEALSGDARLRVARRLVSTEAGARLLRRRGPLSELLADRARLEALPPDSLGRAYLSFCDEAGISAGGLVDASKVEEHRKLAPDERRVHELLRDSHDLWHVVTGYRTDTVGEASVLAFSVAQTWNPGVLLIVLMALVNFRGEHGWVRGTVVQAFLRGCKAGWFPAADWETLLAQPLEEVRRQLGVGRPPVYTPIWSHEIKEQRALLEGSGTTPRLSRQPRVPDGLLGPAE